MVFYGQTLSYEEATEDQTLGLHISATSRGSKQECPSVPQQVHVQLNFFGSTNIGISFM
jgi:hypothetical protein